jgi:hypothetical protein
MKRLFTFLMICVALAFSSPSYSATRFFGANTLTGGAAGSVDNIAAGSISNGDACYAVTSTAFYIFRYNSSSGAAESSPDVIAPDDVAGNGRWILMDIISTTIAPTDLTNTYVPYMTASGLADSPLTTDGTNVGIGTASPERTFEIYGTPLVRLRSSSTTANQGYSAIEFGNSEGAAWNRMGFVGKLENANDNIILGADDSNDIEFETGGSTQMTIDSTGKVGIGTESPTTPLHVDAAGSANSIMTNQIFRLTTGSGTDGLNIGSDGTDAMIGPSDNDMDLHFLKRTGGVYSKAITLDGPTGNVGIGTASPNANTALDVSGVIRASGGIMFGTDTDAANRLDDYEEGTWTPTYVGSGTDFDSVTYDTGVTGGKYTKVGNIVYVQGSIMTDSITVGSATPYVYLGGLPFASASSLPGYTEFGGGGSVSYVASFAGDHPCSLSSQDGSSYLAIRYKTAANGAISNLAIADMGTGANANRMDFHAWYTVN